MNRKRDWKNYNASLINRGSLTIWIDDSLSKEWIEQPKTGRPKFSSHVIKMGLFLREVYKLTLRALQGFLSSILRMMNLSLPCPSYSLFCKRYNEVSSNLPRLSSKRPCDLVIDSSGFKVYGEGEWKVKIHGASKRRQWVKLHIAVDPKSSEIIAAIATDDRTADMQMLPKLIDASPKTIKRVAADGAYDYIFCRNYLDKQGIEALIPPRKNARLRNEKELSSRNDSIEMIHLLGGDKEALSLWKKISGYSSRSLVETAFSRLKMILSEKLKSRKTCRQKVEMILRCHVMNKMIRLSGDN